MGSQIRREGSRVECSGIEEEGHAGRRGVLDELS